MTSGPVVTLPGWCARVAWSQDAEPLPSATAPVSRIGSLAIVDPGQSVEVATFGNGTSAAVFDGYLFDQGDLARELGLDPSAGAAAIAAAAYERWGVGVFDRLDGSYLLAVWDETRRQMLLGHDALGQHPAFYAETPGGLWFSSNVLRLASASGISRELNRLSLALLAFRYWPEAGATFFRAIRRVRPGHFVETGPERSLVERRYFDPLPDGDGSWLSADTVHAEFEPTLVRAVERCLALEPQGIMLSGGVDSVTIAALAAEAVAARGRAPLVAVSGQSGGPLSEEEVMQGKVVSALSMPHVVSTRPEWLAGEDPVRRSLRMTGDLPSPGFVYWVGTYTGFYQLTARQGLTVLLTGSGGDNWLSVADAHAADLLRGLKLGELYRFLKSDLTTGGRSVANVARRRLWAFGVRPLLDSAWARIGPKGKARYHRRRWMAEVPPWLCPDRVLREELVESLLGRRTPSLAGDGRFPRSYYRHSLRSYSNPYMHHENETAFHVNAMCGLRLLSPYHDRRLVSFFMRIPPSVLIHGDRYKGLLRPVVAKHLPNLGLERQKKSYPAADQRRALQEVRESLSRVWADYSFDRLGQLGVVDRRGLGGGPDAAFSLADYEGVARTYALMSAEVWVRNWVSA